MKAKIESLIRIPPTKLLINLNDNYFDCVFTKHSEQHTERTLNLTPKHPTHRRGESLNQNTERKKTFKPK